MAWRDFLNTVKTDFNKFSTGGNQFLNRTFTPASNFIKPVTNAFNTPGTPGHENPGYTFANFGLNLPTNIFQGLSRGGYALGQTLSNDSTPFTPSSRFQRAIFGSQPIQSGQSGPTSTFLQKHGFNPLLAKGIGVAGVATNVGLNFLGGSGEKTLLEDLAKTTSSDAVLSILEKAGAKVSQKAIKRITASHDPQEIASILKREASKLPSEITSSSDATHAPKAPVPAKSTPTRTGLPTLTDQTLPTTVRPQTVPIKKPSLPSSITPERGFLKTVQESTTPVATAGLKTKASALEQTYNVKPNAQTIKQATARLNQGIEAAHRFVTSPLTAPSAEKTATAELLIGKYADLGDTTSLDKASQVLDNITTQLTKAGQATQAAAIWDKLGPANLLKLADREAEKVSQKLPENFRQQLLKRASAITKMTDGADKTQAIQQLWQDVADQLPMTKAEWLQNYRYQNMLSSPTPIEKIGYGGLTNTLITRPADLFGEAITQGIKKGFKSSFQRTVYFSDIPKWYKNVLIGVPEAWQAAVEAFKSGGLTKTFEEGKSGLSVVSDLRQKNVPLVARPFTSAHGAIYSYFSSLISGAEEARLLEKGVSPEEAKSAAKVLGDKLTLRSKLGGQENMSLPVQALDWLGSVPQKLRDSGGKQSSVGGAMSWVAPFMRVSTNWAKLAVEHSPLNFIGKPTTESVGKAFVGSIVTGIGLTYAMQDRVTLAAPSNAKENALFYASGRKPYSVRIGNHWIPLTYFGPYALAFMLPAAVKDASSGSNVGKGAINQIGIGAQNVSKFILASTPLPSVASFFDVLSGSQSYSAASALTKFESDMASQLIPLEALQRYIANIVDPVYRKASTFTQRIESGIPGLSKGLPAYTTPLGQPETKNSSQYLAPYPIGQVNNTYEPALQAEQKVLTSDAYVNAAKKSGGTVGGNLLAKGGQQVAPGIYNLGTGKFAYQLPDGTIGSATTQEKAQIEIDKTNLVNSDQNFTVSGNSLLVKNADGTVSTSTYKNAEVLQKNVNDQKFIQSGQNFAILGNYAYTANPDDPTHPTIQKLDTYNIDLADQSLTAAKNTSDLQTWVNVANQKAQLLTEAISDPTTNPMDKLKYQNQLATLKKDGEKYLSYGGFTKPKAAKTGPTKAQKAQTSLYTSQLASYKERGNIQGWLTTADAQVRNLTSQLNDPNLTETESIRLQNEIYKLQTEADKYTTQGGFTKPKAPKSFSASFVRRGTTGRVSVKKPAVRRPTVGISLLKGGIRDRQSTSIAGRHSRIRVARGATYGA